jgi:hypothetical protein
VKISKRYLRDIIKEIISEKSREERQQEKKINAAADSDEDLKSALIAMEDRLRAFEEELEAIKKERDNAMTSFGRALGQQ